MDVINSAGERETFSFDKLYKSLKRVGAPPQVALKVAKDIERELYPNIKTSEIFKKAKKLIYPASKKAALRFNLREGMRRLGPTGFPFEKFIGEVFSSMGFYVKINQYVPGFCLKDYEIDFIAQKGNLLYVGECKYRNSAGDKVHAKDALVNHARFLDILKGNFFDNKKYRGLKVRSMLVTNEKFTSRALRYSKCNGIELLGWKYPVSAGLESLIESKGLYPISVLSSLRGPLKDIFAAQKMMLVRDVLRIDPAKFSKRFRISSKLIFPLIEEAKILISN